MRKKPKHGSHIVRIVLCPGVESQLGSLDGNDLVQTPRWCNVLQCFPNFTHQAFPGERLLQEERILQEVIITAILVEVLAPEGLRISWVRRLALPFLEIGDALG